MRGVVSAVVALFAATTYLVLRVLIEYDIRAARSAKRHRIVAQMREVAE